MNSSDDSTRRNFLKAAGLALAGIVGAGTMARAQEQEQPEPEKPDEDEDFFGNDDSSEPSEPVEEETRACPQCGALMYRQGRTWTCETCGYSYVE